MSLGLALNAYFLSAVYECRRFQVFLDAFFKNTALGISVEGVECSWKAALVDIFCAWL